jgi:Immunity protein Imm5
MALSAELIETLQIALSKLNSNINGELVLSERKRVWRALRERVVEGNRAVRGPGLIRRVKLATLCVQKVLGLWQEVWPEKTGPQQMLVTAEQYLSDSIDFETAWKRVNTFWAELDTLIYEGKNLTVINVGFAAANTANTALHDEKFNPDDLEEDIFDDGLDPYEWDASLYASAAYSAGFTWEDESNATRRREFWEWYLNEAVPSAWES